MRGFLVGLVLIPVLVIAVLSFRPGGLRSQLRAAGRRLRIALALAGVYLIGSAGLRLAGGGFAEYGPPVLALMLAIVFLALAQSPTGEAVRDTR
ncbi:MAG: hypothetical protein M3Z13_05865 [Candidatus Dormibacteraeota bacterium]|nr:hypothetical protein [Candidatus Dormibacteraeota bacterium]